MARRELMKTIQSYPDIANMLREYSYDDILSEAAAIIGVSEEKLENYLLRLYENSDKPITYKVSVQELTQNLEYYDWVFQKLENDASRVTFANLIMYRVLPLKQFLVEASNYLSAGEETEFLEKTSLYGEAEILQDKDLVLQENMGLRIYVNDSVENIWKLPKLIDFLNADYRYYIKHTIVEERQETTVYVVPIEEKITLPLILSDKKNVVAMAPYTRGWSNVELLKDCGLIPYLLYKNHNCDVTFVGAYNGDYPYWDKYLKGVKMEFLSSGEEIDKLAYLEKNAFNIDCLILRGCYDSNWAVAATYKRLNPTGRIYVGLDANSHWMDRIRWNHPAIAGFMNCCDVIATSCTAMQDYLNQKWPWKIEHIPNGYYSFEKQDKIINFENKKNVILTVSRLGTQQKATHILLEAFAKVAQRLSTWELQLVGSVEPAFEAYIKEYYERYPWLLDRVHFLGSITDKNELRKKYLDAKIFALSSILEGGTPNVIGEALSAGCVIATTKIDAWQDAIGNGKCGMASNINDIEGFSDMLVSLCNDMYLKNMSEEAILHAQNHFNMEKIVARLNRMLFGENADG